MKILSIDWDYFWPSTSVYDWGHKESMFFIEMIWPMRCGNCNLYTRQPMLDVFKPTIPEDFWEIVTNKPIVYVAESHSSIWNLLRNDCEVVNLDAHHDCGYRQEKDTGNIFCDDWGYWGKVTGKIKHMTTIYPKWRMKDKEGYYEEEPDEVAYELPQPCKYDKIFICRSGSWTAPWYDIEFSKFIRQLKEPKFMDDTVQRNRSPSTLEEAKMIGEHFSTQLAGVGN